MKTFSFSNAVVPEAGLRTSMLFSQSAQRFEALFQNLPVACFCYDAGGRIIEWNHAFETLFRLQGRELRHKSVWDLIEHPEGREMNERIIARVFSGESFEGLEWEHRDADGSIKHILCNTFPLRDSEGVVTAGITIDLDITAQKRAEQALRQSTARFETLAMQDSLTGLKNHRAFRERLDREMNQARRCLSPLSIVMLDVDHFKQFNDQYGHPAGDEVLTQVAGLLSKHARETDLAARYGGEEFVVILPHTDHAGAEVLAERFRSAIASAHWPRRGITASFGIASLSTASLDATHLIREADSAMYASKEAGRNHVTHYASLAASSPHVTHQTTYEPVKPISVTRTDPPPACALKKPVSSAPPQ